MDNGLSIALFKENILMSSDIEKDAIQIFEKYKNDETEKNIISENKYRVVIAKGSIYKVIMISSIKAHKKSKKVSNSECYAILQRCSKMDEMIKNEQENIKKKFSMFTHNIKTICTMSLQEIDTFSPTGLTSEPSQEKLNDHKLFKKEIEKSSYSNLASKIMRVYKNMQNIGNDIQVYDHLYNNVSLDTTVRYHSAHKIVTRSVLCCASLLHENKIPISIEPFNEPVKVDFESVQVALFYVMDNIVKYTKPQTRLEISFNKQKERKEIEVIFKTRSLYVEKSEETKIFENSFSGKQAIQCKKNGSGVGMFAAKEMLKLSNARIDFISSDENLEHTLGRVYSDNKVVITFQM